ncbi:hypothetical protein [Parabacteroides johnsonii]|uniref:hypothetical protein n=1 Tax=Parabacteroides johnsonii TaxID=387661 RepID=UPI00307EB45A
MDYLTRKGGEGLKFTRTFVIAALSFVLIGCGDTFALVVGGACFVDQLVELRDEKCSLSDVSKTFGTFSEVRIGLLEFLKCDPEFGRRF